MQPNTSREGAQNYINREQRTAFPYKIRFYGGKAGVFSSTYVVHKQLCPVRSPVSIVSHGLHTSLKYMRNSAVAKIVRQAGMAPAPNHLKSFRVLPPVQSTVLRQQTQATYIGLFPGLGSSAAATLAI